MSTIRYKKFNRPNFLKKIRVDVLYQFLQPYSEYLDRRGLWLSSYQIDCDLLVQILATPDSDTPPDLVEVLEICDAVCFMEVLEELVELDRAREHQFLDSGHSLADAVLLTWIHAPSEIERIYNRAALELDRSLTVYRANTPIRSEACSRFLLDRLEAVLQPHFEGNLRGSSCRVSAVPRADESFALVIKHGDPINKIDVIDDSGETKSMVLRPEQIDVAFYDAGRSEWRISGRAKWLQSIYSSAFASILHCEGCHLHRSISYSLAPLRDQGLTVLDHHTYEIRDVRLAELHIALSGATMRLSGRGLREQYESMSFPLIEFGEPKWARFAFSLTNRRTASYITIHQGRAAVRGDIDHPAIENWLTDMGFLISKGYEVGTVGSN